MQLQPVSITSRANTRVYNNRIIQRRPFDCGVSLAQLAYVIAFSSTNSTRQCNLFLQKCQKIRQPHQNYMCVHREKEASLTRLASAAARSVRMVREEARERANIPPDMIAVAAPKALSGCGTPPIIFFLTGVSSNTWCACKYIYKFELNRVYRSFNFYLPRA